MMWDPSLDPDALITEFLAGYYSPVAAPFVRLYVSATAGYLSSRTTVATIAKRDKVNLKQEFHGGGPSCATWPSVLTNNLHRGPELGPRFGPTLCNVFVKKFACR
jgi:hypothetical protein